MAQALEDYERTLGEIGSGKVTAVYEKQVADKLFRGILYDGQKITDETLQSKDIKPTGISLTDGYMNEVKFRRRKERMLEGDDGTVIDYFNKQFSENMEKIMEGIKLSFQEASSTMRDTDAFLEIRDDILSFMGATSKKVLQNKDKIYAYWEGISEKHGDVVKAMDALLEPEEGLDDKALEQFNKGMKGLRTAFEPIREMNYIIPFEPRSVQESHEELLALDLLEAFQMRIGRSIDDNENFFGDMERGEVDPTQMESEIADEVADFYGKTSDRLDPISRYYISKMLNGIFVDSMKKESTIEQVKDLAVTFGMDEIDLRNLDKFLADIPDIAPTQGDVLLPAEFGEGFLTQTVKVDGEDVQEKKDINAAYSRFMEELAKVIETGAFRIGRREATMTDTFASPVRGRKAVGEGESSPLPVPQKDLVSLGYKASFSTRGMSWKELEKGQAEKVNAVINALNDYLFVPISNKVMTLGHSFRDLRRTKEFKIISVYADTRTPQTTSPSTKAVSVLYQRLERRGASAFPQETLHEFEQFYGFVENPI